MTQTQRKDQSQGVPGRDNLRIKDQIKGMAITLAYISVEVKVKSRPFQLNKRTTKKLENMNLRKAVYLERDRHISKGKKYVTFGTGVNRNQIIKQEETPKGYNQE